MTLLETEADPNIRVGPLRWGRPIPLRVPLEAAAMSWTTFLSLTTDVLGSKRT